MKPSATVSAASHFLEIDRANIHYVQQGEGDPIVFLHDMPASSYVWRKVIPHLAKMGCCIAVDLIGTGKSDKPNIAYTITDHIYFIERFIEKLQLKNITFVMHGWGSIIGFDYAMKHPNNCKGLVFYEAYLRPMHNDDISLPYQEQILSLQQHESVSDLILNSPYFVDTVLPQSATYSFSEEELQSYREPFLKQNSGKVLQQYLREIPNGDGKSKVDEVIANYSTKLARSDLPKLMLYSIPGFITTIATILWAKRHLPNIELIELGEELHYAQETYPEFMGESISAWLQAIEQQNMKTR